MRALPIALPEQAIAEFCRGNGIRRLALFGSVLRDDFSPESDVDLLVEFEPTKRIGLIGFERLQIDLTQMLGRKVDLNTAGFLSPYFVEEVLREAVPVYVAP